MSPERPLAWIDLETTGLDVKRDRIIEISILREEPGGELTERTRKLNPGIPIPAASTAIHGIRDDDVRHEATFEQVARSLAVFLEGADLGGFGVKRFDVPLLQAEFNRAGTSFSLEGRAIVDTQTIYHRLEPRDLSAATRFYLGRELDSAHTASADAHAAREIFRAQLEKYPHLPRDIVGLDAMFRDPNAIDPDGRLVWQGDLPVIKFGKHRGRGLPDLVENERDYLNWILSSDFPEETKTIIRLALEGEFPSRSG